jgi:hypothetical protein
VSCSTLRAYLPGVGDWEVSQLEQDPAILYLHMKNAGPSEVAAVAAGLDQKIMKEMLRAPDGYWYYPLGRQERLEDAIDRACNAIQTPGNRFPGLPMVEVTARFPRVTDAAPRMRVPFKTDDLLAEGALYSRIRYPMDGTGLTVTDAVVSCRDLEGRRFAMAQERMVPALRSGTLNGIPQKLRQLDKGAAKTPKASRLRLSGAWVRWNRFLVSVSHAQLEWVTHEPFARGYLKASVARDEMRESLELLAHQDRKALGEAEREFARSAKAFRLRAEEFLTPEEQTLNDKDFELVFPGPGPAR